MQNVFPSRELYNPNPCREIRDNAEEMSQMAVSFSQSSQNSSSDLFSQSCVSQLKGYNSFDTWSQASNSQQLHEDEPVKYYMKYMSKPPLFSDESSKKPVAASSYKDLIEIQKKNTAERDDRDVLDSFISLLKDYTKEVKSAMDSFKDSIDTTLATKAEEVASAAIQSAELIKRLKEDLFESFGCLRKDLRENEELKHLISKQNETILEQESKLKLLQAQLDDCRARELKDVKEHQKYMEREDKLMEKLKEISSKQVNPLSTLPANSQIGTYNTFSDCTQNQGSEIPLCHNPSNLVYQPIAHHAYPKMQYPTQRIHCSAAGGLEFNDQGTYFAEAAPAMNYLQPTQLIQKEAIFASVKTSQCQGPIQGPFVPNQHSVPQPTATIAPMRSSLDENQRLYCYEQNKTNECGLTSSVLRKQNEAVSIISHESSSREATSRVFASPGDSVPAVVNASWPKQSPMAAVQPQIRVKTEDEGDKRKECAKKLQKEDPFDIFVFDLTSSPDDDSYVVLTPKPASPKTAPTYTVDKPHITRSQAKRLISSESKSSTSSAKSSEIITKMQRKISAVSQLHDKFSKVKEESTCLRGQRTPTSKYKEIRCNDSICYGGKNTISKTPNQPVKTSPKNGVPVSKVAQNVSQKSKIPFKRNVLAAKRKLSFDASGLFEDLDGDANLQQITQSIRKHAERKTASKVS